MEGTVKFFNRRKGFGFILGDDGKDYFVHFSALPQGVFLRENDKVSFNGSEGDRGLKAENVQLLQKGSERESSAPREHSPKDDEEESENTDESDESQESETSEDPE